MPHREGESEVIARQLGIRSSFPDTLLQPSHRFFSMIPNIPLVLKWVWDLNLNPQSHLNGFGDLNLSFYLPVA